MGFASTYLEQRVIFPEIVKEAPDKNTGIIIIVPSYNEPDIRKLLDSLALCREPLCKTEVLIIVNAPGNALPESLENNQLTLAQIESWKKENRNCFFRLYSFMASPVKGWGVGLARKTGMDEATRRFDKIDKKEGIILSLDADCTVAENYLEAVYSGFMSGKNNTACSIYFEHPLKGKDYPEEIFSHIALYELHLRYYFQGLSFTGYPYVFHTVGSAMAIKVLPYIKAGGMNRKQAGEDFYLIQKLVPSGGYFNINSTAVYPSPRPSFRVPFGTGATIARLNESVKPVLYTYNFQAFKELKSFFELTQTLFQSNSAQLAVIYENLPAGIKAFVGLDEFIGKITEIQNNTSGFPSFEKRFFGWFNMFKVVKYLNFVHVQRYKKKLVEESALELLREKDNNPASEKPSDLLLQYREMERQKGN
jgi:hypothetical protein